jgi:hypothetical protein
VIERPDFNMVAHVDGDDRSRREARLVRHHPAGCQGHVASRGGEGKQGWHAEVGTPEELANKRPCLLCIAILEGRSTHWRRRPRRPVVPRPRRFDRHQRAQILSDQGDRCADCGRPFDPNGWTGRGPVRAGWAPMFHHVVRHTDGGRTDEDNCVALCCHCHHWLRHHRQLDQCPKCLDVWFGRAPKAQGGAK